MDQLLTENEEAAMCPTQNETSHESQTMKPIVLKALKQSIRKWKSIIAGKGVDRGTDNCALCYLFHYRYTGCLCQDKQLGICPVQIATGAAHCCLTAYALWDESQPFNKWPRKIRNKTDLKLAEAEVEFLQSLLPKG